MNKTQKPINTRSKAAIKAIEKYIALVMRNKAESLREIAEAEGHGPRWIKNRLDARAKELDAIRNAPGLESINIAISWRKSRIWGNNPTAEATILANDGRYLRATGTASGCGYDKESAAIADALNQCPALLRLLIVAAGNKRLAYGATVGKWSAHLDGGTGVSAFRNVFEGCGYTFETIASGKNFDVYRIHK